MHCIFTTQAEKDLKDIADYIALDNPARSKSFIQEIRKRCHEITYAPLDYPLSCEYGKNIHKLPFGNYLILYTIQVENIIIVHIPHSSRNSPKH